MKRADSGKPLVCFYVKIMKKKEIYEAEIIEVIKKHKICRISHIFSFYTKLRSSQFYNLGLDKSDELREAIDNNRTKAKTYMLHKWITGDNATLQVAAYRLLADSDEHRLLNQQYIEANVKLKEVPPLPPITIK